MSTTTNETSPSPANANANANSDAQIVIPQAPQLMQAGQAQGPFQQQQQQVPMNLQNLHVNAANPASLNGATVNGNGNGNGNGTLPNPGNGNGNGNQMFMNHQAAAFAAAQQVLQGLPASNNVNMQNIFNPQAFLNNVNVNVDPSIKGPGGASTNNLNLNMNPQQFQQHTLAQTQAAHAAAILAASNFNPMMFNQMNGNASNPNAFVFALMLQQQQQQQAQNAANQAQAQQVANQQQAQAQQVAQQQASVQQQLQQQVVTPPSQSLQQPIQQQQQAIQPPPKRPKASPKAKKNTISPTDQEQTFNSMSSLPQAQAQHINNTPAVSVSAPPSQASTPVSFNAQGQQQQHPQLKQVTTNTSFQIPVSVQVATPQFALPVVSQFQAAINPIILSQMQGWKLNQLGKFEMRKGQSCHYVHDLID